MCASAVVMLDTPCSEVVWRVLATHYIRQFPLHLPSHASPCTITFQLESNCLLVYMKPPSYCLKLIINQRYFHTFVRALNSVYSWSNSVAYSSDVFSTIWPPIFSIASIVLSNIVQYVCILFRLNKGWPTRWHLLYYLLLNMFQTLIRPSSGACDYLLCCVGW